MRIPWPADSSGPRNSCCHPSSPHEAGSWLTAPSPQQESSIWGCLWRPYSSLGTNLLLRATRGASACGMPSPSTGRSGCWLSLSPVSRLHTPLRWGFFPPHPTWTEPASPAVGQSLGICVKGLKSIREAFLEEGLPSSQERWVDLERREDSPGTGSWNR